MKICFLFIFFTCMFYVEVIGTTVLVNNCVDGYYWRDYLGTIPSDAVPGGKDSNGRSMYIGQTIYPYAGVIVPGKIIESEKRMYFEFENSEHSETVDVKILCSQNPERLRWIPTETKASKLAVVGDQELIIGGHDRPHPVAIGRTLTAGEVEVGKVLVRNNEFYVLRITTDGQARRVRNFAVLVYNSNMDMLNQNNSNYNSKFDKTVNIYLYT